MEIRLLKKNEYHKLEGLIHLHDWIPDPRDSEIVVAEDNGEIVGFWVLQLKLHAEPVWIKDEYRNGSLGFRMWKYVIRITGDIPLYAHSAIDAINGYLKRLGWKERGTLFSYNEIEGK